MVSYQLTHLRRSSLTSRRWEQRWSAILLALRTVSEPYDGRLAGAGGERSARLAERLAVAKPTLTATAAGLVDAGYAQREAEAGDRRVVRLCLTPAGLAALERADAAYADWLGPLLGATGDTAAILEAFRSLDATMDERRRARRGVA